jgi:single-strand DNA-binding protein
MYNTIITACHLVNDPELKEVGSDKKVCKMRIAISNPNSKTKCFIDCEAWDRNAEICSQYLKKGREVLIQGELCMDSWKQDEKTMTKYFIKASNIQFLSSGKKDESTQSGPVERKTQQTTQASSSQSSDEDIPF